MTRLSLVFSLAAMAIVAIASPSQAQFVTVVGAPGLIADFQQIHNHNRLMLNETRSIDQTQSDLETMFATNPGTDSRMYNPVTRADMIESMPTTGDVNNQMFFGNRPANRTSFGGRVYYDVEDAFQASGPAGIPALGAQDAEAKKTLEELAGISNVIQMAHENLGDLDDREKLANDGIRMINRASNITEATIFSGRLAAENMIISTQIAQAVNLQTLALSQLGVRDLNEAAVQREERKATARMFVLP